ncbi:superoxide dismutase family protein [Cohnella nanjingensis]|uniref:Superoxide dismutase [Cu-Zn] n=1 Tax=Cohnella nanjingensis TaxID=1387779 RepID=A0A7X0RWY3_9BACL|nr:superoxide dismutase family protein [Cohnella nanjingensis]MBB6675110.1 superoxide dismutase family protein [Cohnella nanjingensis]
MKIRIAALCMSALTLLWAGAAAYAPSAQARSETSPVVNVKIVNAKGEEIGQARITQLPGAVRIHLEAKNLPPGAHGIHFHETGSCEPPDFKSAGAHLNPENKQHGFHNPKGFHAGDLPNIQVAADGTVNADVESKHVTLAKGTANSLLKPGGTALVIHDKADDYVTDPTGNSGDRIACGRIQ